MQFLNQLFVLGQTWTGSAVTLFLLALALLMRRVVPAEQRATNTVALFFLSLALLSGLSAIAALQLRAYTVWGLLSFLDLLSLIVGVTCLVGVVVFDLILRRTRVRVPSLVRNLINCGFIVLIVLTILYQRGLDPLSLLTTSAVLTAVIGLALQNTIANLFAGLALHLDRTLGINDWIQVGDKIGRIVEIKWRSTSLWTEEGDLLIVPNSRLLDAEVFNLSRPDDVQRFEVKVGFHYRHAPNEVKRVLLDAVRGVPKVLVTPEPDCIVKDFSDSSILYAVRYWISDYTHHALIESEARTRIWYAAQRTGLEIPFPIRTLVMEPPKATVDVVADHRSALEQTGLFAMLSSEDCSTLVAKMKTVTFGAGEVILREGDAGGALHIVRSGEVAAYVSANGSRREVAALKPGDFFGELPLMAGESQPAGYAAKSDVACSLMDHAALAPVLDAHPQIADDLCAALTTREMALNGGRQELSAAAQTRHSTETKQRLLARMQQVFRVG